MLCCSILFTGTISIMNGYSQYISFTGKLSNAGSVIVRIFLPEIDQTDDYILILKNSQNQLFTLEVVFFVHSVIYDQDIYLVQNSSLTEYPVGTYLGIQLNKATKFRRILGLMLPYLNQPIFDVVSLEEK